MPGIVTMPQRFGRGAWKWAKRMVRVYLVVALLFALFQSKLIFIGASTQGKAESVVSTPPGSELVRMRAGKGDGLEISGLFGKATDGGDVTKKPTVIYFYGNAMCMNDSLNEFAQFRRLGANVIMVDYAGYGMSGGEPSETGCYDAADAAYGYLLTRTDIDRNKLVPTGWSLGGAVAVDLAARHAHEGHICGLMVFSAFTSMAEVGQWHYPMFPVSLLLRHRFESEKKLAKIDVPILIGHGCKDSIVPFSMSERLVKAARGKVTRIVCEGADHNDFFDIAEEDVNREVAIFLKAASK